MVKRMSKLQFENVYNFLFLKAQQLAKYTLKNINEGMRGNTINTIINTLHEKNPREEQHSQRVSELCQYIGKAIGFSDIKVSKLKIVGLLHDIGKIAIADSYDAMTSGRSYRNALSEEEALAEIRTNAGKQFDPEIARIFVEKVLLKR